MITCGKLKTSTTVVISNEIVEKFIINIQNEESDDDSFSNHSSHDSSSDMGTN